MIEGYEIETDKHLITIEEVLSSDSPHHNLPLTNTKNLSNSRTKGFSTPSQYSSEEASVSKHLRKSHSDINTNFTVCTMTSEPVKVKSNLNTNQLLHPTDKTGGHFLSQNGKGNCQKFEFTSSHIPSKGADYYEKTGSVPSALNNKRSVSQILDILKTSDERSVNQGYPVNPLAITTKDSNNETNFSSVFQYSNSPLQQSLVPQTKKLKQSCESPDDLMLIPALVHRANRSSSKLPYLPVSSELKFSCVVSRSQNFETNSNSLTSRLSHEYLSPEVQSTHGELIVPPSNDPYVHVYSDSTEEQLDAIVSVQCMCVVLLNVYI